MKIDTKDGNIFCMKTDLVDVAKSDGPISMLVSTEAQDSDGDIIVQRKSKNGLGWVLDRFNKAPVVTWSHDIWTPNLSGPKTKAKVKRHPEKGFGLHLDPLTFDDGDPLAVTIEGKIRRDVLKESSVGFKIIDREPIRDEDGRHLGLKIFTSELIEVAIVNRGANPETETLAKRMLSKAAVSGDLETAGIAEIAELKEEIEYLSQQIELLSGVVKTLGTMGKEEEMMKVKEEARDRQNEVTTAAGELLKSLRSAGIAR